MGSKHPTSFKLKKYYFWNSTLYKFDSSSLCDYGIQKNIIKSINHYFQNILISKPVLHFENDVLKIEIFYYKKPYSIHKFKPSWYKTQIIKFEKFLKKFYGYPIKIQLIKLNNPIFNANILAQLIAINLKTHSLRKIWRKLQRKMRFMKTRINQKIRRNLNMTSRVLDTHLNWMHILNKNIFCKEFLSHIIGLKLKLSGRITKRKGASRTKITNRSIGTLQLNSIHSFIDYSHIEKKDKNGSQSIKIYIANSISAIRKTTKKQVKSRKWKYIKY